MGKYSKETTEEHKEAIRTILIQNPESSILRVQDELEKEEAIGIKLDKDYIHRLVKGIREERISKRQMRNKEILFEDFIRETALIKERLWDIVNDNKSSPMEKVSAYREIRIASGDLLTRITKSGMFTLESPNSFTSGENIASMSVEELEEYEQRLAEDIGRRVSRITKLRTEAQDFKKTLNEGMNKENTQTNEPTETP